MLLTKAELEMPRTPRNLWLFVRRKKRQIEGIREERHKAYLGRGYYKEFHDELMPLSGYVLKRFGNDVTIELVLGNQSHDALVKSEGKIVEILELTFPQDGEYKARSGKKLVETGIGEGKCYAPGGEISEIVDLVLRACHKKAAKDYSGKTLVICIAFFPPFKQFYPILQRRILELAEEIRKVQYSADRVDLFVSTCNEVIRIK